MITKSTDAKRTNTITPNSTGKMNTISMKKKKQKSTKKRLRRRQKTAKKNLSKTQNTEVVKTTWLILLVLSSNASINEIFSVFQ